MAKLKFEDLDKSITSGLSPAERDRLQDCYFNLRFSQGQFAEFSERGERISPTASDNWDINRPSMSSNPDYSQEEARRSSPVFKRVMEVLTGNLYKAPVGRHLATPEASEWLKQVYQHNAMSAKWQRADQLSLIGGYAAFQFAGDDNEDCPVKVHLWGPDQVIVWVDPDDQTQPAAIATLDKYDGQRRLTLWTDEIVAYYETKKGGPYSGDGGAMFVQKTTEPNPYRVPEGLPNAGKGILPFTFAHWEFPTQEFTTTNPGDALRELNDCLNFGLNELGDGVRYLSKPIGLAEGVDAGWSPPAVVKPGMFLNLPASSVDAAGNGPVPTLRYLSPELAFIESCWADLNNYLDHSLEMHGVPPSTIRMSLNAQSGVAIVAEQYPLLTFAEKRRRPFAIYEERAAHKCLLVGASHLLAHGHTEQAQVLLDAVKDPRLALTWPRMYVQLPGPEQRQADDWRVMRGYADKVLVLMEQLDMSEDQAFEHFSRIVERNKKLAALGIDPTVPDPGSRPDPMAGFTGFGTQDPTPPATGPPAPGTKANPIDVKGG